MIGYPIDDSEYLLDFEEGMPPACNCMETFPITIKPEPIKRYQGAETPAVASEIPAHRIYEMGAKKNSKKEQWHLYTNRARLNTPFKYIGIEPCHILLSHTIHRLWRAIAEKQGSLSPKNPLQEYKLRQTEDTPSGTKSTDRHPIWWDEDYWGEWVGTFESAVRWHIDRYISRDGRRYSIELVSQREADDITYLKHQLEIEQLINQHFPQRHNGIDAIKLLMSMHKLSSQQVVEVASV